MSGSQSKPAPPNSSGQGPGPGPDPSMEDILASIRRILSEDEPQPAAAPPTDPAPPEEDSDVLVLDASMEVADAPESQPAVAEPAPSPAPDVAPAAPPAAAPAAASGAAAAPEAAPEPVFTSAPAALLGPTGPSPDPAGMFPEPNREQALPEPDVVESAVAKPTGEPTPPGLIAPEIAAAAASAVGNLLRTLASERSTRVHASGPTIEDLVREELRPLLKQWLDAHLPDLVERLVHTEIERVVRRAVP